MILPNAIYSLMYMFKNKKSYTMKPFTPELNPVVYQGTTPIDEVELDKLADKATCEYLPGCDKKTMAFITHKRFWKLAYKAAQDKGYSILDLGKLLDDFMDYNCRLHLDGKENIKGEQYLNTINKK